MIDFTTLQFEPIPMELSIIQNENTVLCRKNKSLNNMIVYVIFGSLAIIAGIAIYYNKKTKD